MQKSSACGLGTMEYMISTFSPACRVQTGPRTVKFTPTFLYDWPIYPRRFVISMSRYRYQLKTLRRRYVNSPLPAQKSLANPIKNSLKQTPTCISAITPWLSSSPSHQLLKPRNASYMEKAAPNGACKSTPRTTATA
jgi:hypothetical protein